MLFVIMHGGQTGPLKFSMSQWHSQDEHAGNMGTSTAWTNSAQCTYMYMVGRSEGMVSQEKF